MANKVQKSSKTPAKKHYKTPTDTWWGKLLVWLLFFGMIGFVLVGFIVLIIKGGF